jgi:hypothetical protein
MKAIFRLKMDSGKISVVVMNYDRVEDNADFLEWANRTAKEFQQCKGVDEANLILDVPVDGQVVLATSQRDTIQLLARVANM